MTGKDALTQQYGFFYLIAKRNLDGFGPEDSVVQPSPDGNCANWILGHLIDVHNAAMGLVNESPVWDSDELARTTEGPITCADEALDWSTMVAKLLESEPRFMAALDALSEEQLDEDGFTDPFGNAVTRGALLNLLGVHQSYHAGQLGMSRRLAGLEGAIRSPRSPA